MKPLTLLLLIAGLGIAVAVGAATVVATHSGDVPARVAIASLQRLAETAVPGRAASPTVGDDHRETATPAAAVRAEHGNVMTAVINPACASQVRQDQEEPPAILLGSGRTSGHVTKNAMAPVAESSAKVRLTSPLGDQESPQLAVQSLMAEDPPVASANFDGGDPLAGWTTTGTVAVDATRDHTSGGGLSLKVSPGATATWKLRTDDWSGSVDVWVYEDGTTRASPSSYGAGPQIGLVTNDGRVLTVGAIYASYLSGNTTYAQPEYYPATQSPWYKVTYLATTRAVGWHHWRFVFDPTLGYHLYHNGVENTRINWTTSQVRGFAGVVVLGDLNADNPQSTWVDDVTVTLGGAMAVGPGEVNLLAGIIPDTDPVVTGPTPEIVPELANVHPRLLLTQADLADLDAFKATPDGQRLWNVVLSYRNAALDPGNTSFQTNATEGQRKGFWRLPTVALYYAMTRDRAYYDKALAYMQFLLGLQHWETGSEIDSGMSAANMMVGAALAYDLLYNDLDPVFREQFRQKLWLHARRMYYAGHLMYLNNTHYWQADPQNNHRWHRNAGLTLCALAAWTGDESQKWLMQQLMNELTYMSDWLPDDGTNHEGPGYMVFGGSQLTVGLDAADRCLGTEFLTRLFFQNCCRYLIQTHAPGYDKQFNYGDQGGVDVGIWGYHVFQLKAAAVSNQPDVVSMLDSLMDRHGVDSIAAWAGFLWYPRNVAKGTGGFTDTEFFADLGLLFMREGWATGGAGAMFKCGPFGGYELNRYRVQRGYAYVNVAHDDPDANTFLLFGGNTFLAETDRYSSHKKSANLNSILINGLGQMSSGRPEGGTWSQPATGTADMTKMAVVTAYAKSGEVVAVEGEAAGSYLAVTQSGLTRPAMDRMRRTFVWVEGKYVLVLDDIRAPQSVEVAWLMQGKTLTTVDATAGRYLLADGLANCPFQVVADRVQTATTVVSSADNKGVLMNWQQLRLTSNSAALRVASAYDLWNRGAVTIALNTTDANRASVTVSGTGFADVWSWECGQGRFGPAKLAGQTSDGTAIITMTEPEPATRTLVADITGDRQPIAGAWQAVMAHEVAEQATALLERAIVSRVGGYQRLELSFTTPLNAATVNASAVSIVGQVSGSQAARIQSAALVGETRLVVTLASPLPDADRYTITLSSAVRGANGSTVMGDGDVTIGVLAGDVDGSGVVTAADLMAVRAALGQPVTAATARYDVNGSGTITNTDLMAVQRRLGKILP